MKHSLDLLSAACATLAFCILATVAAALVVHRSIEAVFTAIEALPDPEPEPVEEVVKVEEPVLEEAGEPVFERLIEQMPYQAKRFSSTRYYDETLETSRSSIENDIPSRSDPPSSSATSRTNYDDNWGGWQGVNGRPYWYPDATFHHHIGP